jgi:hypothetical protein
MGRRDAQALEPCLGDVEPVVGDERDEQRFGVSQVAAGHVGPRGRSGEGDAARCRHAEGAVDEGGRCPFPPVVDRVGELLADRQERVPAAVQRLVEACGVDPVVEAECVEVGLVGQMERRRRLLETDQVQT